MDRRTFLGWVGVGALASSLPVAIVACSDSQSSNAKVDTKAKAATKDSFYEIGMASELETKGFLISNDIAGKSVMVFRNPETNQLVALNPKCTHQRCTVDLDKEKALLTCPCHDSHFTFDGQVAQAPASQPLDVYQVKEEANLILVKVG